MSNINWQEIWAELGIHSELVDACKLPLYEETLNLVSAGVDIFDREQFVTAATLNCWQKMKAAAQQNGIDLAMISAFRSVDYQCQLIRDKLEKGQDIRDILKVNAIPGFSEHHTGRAIDLTTRDCKPLSEDFAKTLAFEWLTANAGNFHFAMSYPKDNIFDIDYEPWHWACQKLE
ncbi:MAG: D-alanyl-D-alanine carboxypeptidase family protein [Proteobacteria bacterium]|nr:D-alanyl-D-alanine carboxypeptidase family protein [Pseudomonadota bacterium]